MKRFAIHTQPNDTTCGPTSLQAVYNHYNDPINLSEVINEVEYLESGGTLGVFLGTHALKRGYNVTIYSYNLKIIDPSWLPGETGEIIKKMEAQLKYKRSLKLKAATNAYIEFLNAGGKLRQDDLNTSLLKDYLKSNIPVIVGLSATYLYRSRREYDVDGVSIYDDIKGSPVGHFIVLYNFNDESNEVLVADPYKGNPFSGDNNYLVNSQRLLNSILLGSVTYDANILIIQPK
jgi:hypothetical protein